MTTLKFITILLFLTKTFCVVGQTKEDYFTEGVKIFDKGFYVSAIEMFTEAISLDSNYSDAYYYRGLSYKKGTYADIHPKIVENFIKAISLDTSKNYWEAYFYLARLAQFIDTSYYKLFDKAIQFNPTNPEIYYNRGQFYYWKRLDFQKGVDDYFKMLELDKNNVDALNSIAFYYQTVTYDYENAKEYYLKVLKRRPKDITTYEKLAQVYCHQKEIKKRDKLLKKLTKLSDEYSYEMQDNCNFNMTKKVRE